MRRKHARTLERVFARPTAASLTWNEVESMLVAFGAHMSEGRGSRIRVELHGVRAVFHRPHPPPEIDRGTVTSVRRFLEAAGITP